MDSGSAMCEFCDRLLVLSAGAVFPVHPDRGDARCSGSGVRYRRPVPQRSPDYPRRVGLVGSSVAELALVEVAAGCYAMIVDTDQNTITVPLHTTPLAAHVAGWIVSERDLVAGLEAALLEATAVAVVELDTLRAELAATRELLAVERQQADTLLRARRAELDRRAERLRANTDDAVEAAAAIGEAIVQEALGHGYESGKLLASALAAMARIGGGS